MHETPVKPHSGGVAQCRLGHHLLGALGFPVHSALSTHLTGLRCRVGLEYPRGGLRTKDPQVLRTRLRGRSLSYAKDKVLLRQPVGPRLSQTGSQSQF